MNTLYAPRNIFGRLELVSRGANIMIGNTDGEDTIAGATDFFTGGIDPDFEEYGTDVGGNPKDGTPAQVYQLIEDGSFAQMLAIFEKNPDQLCFEQDQILFFCRYYATWLPTELYATFFPFKVKGEYFLAGVRRPGGQPAVSAYYRKDERIWHAKYGYRLVLPLHA